MIGVDPHKGSNTAVALDGAENVLGQVRVIARGDQLDLGATRHQIGQSVTQPAGNVHIEPQDLTDSFRFLNRDHDAKVTSSFDVVLADAEIEILRSPGHRANAHAERWIGTARRECVDRALIFTERPPRSVLTEYEEHDNAHRPHRSRDQRPRAATSEPVVPTRPADSTVHRTDLLACLNHEYRPAA